MSELIGFEMNASGFLTLRLSGLNLGNIVLEKCFFDIGFPFGKNPDKIKINRNGSDADLDVVK
jgi:hypothetical protein